MKFAFAAGLALILLSGAARADDAPALPKNVAKALDAAPVVTLYGLQPHSGPDLPAWDFHGQHIIGHADLKGDNAKRAAGALKDAVAQGINNAVSMRPFTPRQGLRFAARGHVYDAVMSYPSGHLELYEDGHPVAFNGLIRGKQDVLNALLSDANIPLADTPQALNDSYVDEAKQARTLADTGDKKAQEVLGHLLTSGRGVATDEAEGIQWLSRAAGLAQTDPAFEVKLGKMYATGTDIKQDYMQAMKQYQAAADQDDAAGEYMVGDMYESGAGRDQNHEEAMKWFLKAAAKGDARAQYNIGMMYARGWGVGQDYPSALEWFMKAAEQGHPDALSWIADMYRTGMGATADREQAYFWSRLAQEYGTSYSGGIPELPTDQKDAMEKKVADWKKTHKPCGYCAD